MDGESRVDFRSNSDKVIELRSARFQCWIQPSTCVNSTLEADSLVQGIHEGSSRLSSFHLDPRAIVHSSLTATST